MSKRAFTPMADDARARRRLAEAEEEAELSRAERAYDPLMSHMRRELRGSDYSGAGTVRHGRLTRLDEVLEGVKERYRPLAAQDPHYLGVEAANIDRPLSRAALNSLTKDIYEPHRQRMLSHGAYIDDARHGRHESDLYFAALHEHLKRDGFTPEASARFDFDSESAKADANAFVGDYWEKYGDSAPADARPRSELRNRYEGNPHFGAIPFGENFERRAPLYSKYGF
jgi:hypothetical protein